MESVNAVRGNETGTEMIIPVDLSKVAFIDLAVVHQSSIARKTQLRSICTDAVDVEWTNLTPLLSPKGDFAGGAQFAHAIVSYRVYLACEEQFDSLGGVTLSELWPLIHELLKKRALVFKGGFIVGMRP